MAKAHEDAECHCVQSDEDEFVEFPACDDINVSSKEEEWDHEDASNFAAFPECLDESGQQGDNQEDIKSVPQTFLYCLFEFKTVDNESEKSAKREEDVENLHKEFAHEVVERSWSNEQENECAKKTCERDNKI